MDQMHTDDLPPESDELGTRMSMERPVADDRVLDRVKTRAFAAHKPRSFRMMWRSTAPRARRKGLAFGAAGIMAASGAAGLAVAGAGAQGSVVTPTCANQTPILVSLTGFVGDIPLNTVITLPGVLGNQPIIVVDAPIRVGNEIFLHVCVVV